MARGPACESDAMELFFRKYFWVVNLVFLAVAAFLVARIANTIVAARLRPPVSSLMPRTSGPALQTTQKRQLSAEALSKLTGIALPEDRQELSGRTYRLYDL